MKKLFGKKIKELRIKKGLTQERLAEMVNMGERNLSKIECGLTFVSADTLKNLAIALGVPTKELFDFELFSPTKNKKQELLTAITNDSINIELLYKIYYALK